MLQVGAIGGQVRSSEWCGCSSSLIPVLGAAALGAACGSSLGLFPARGVVAHGQRGVEQHESPQSPRGQLKRGEMGPKATIF